MSIQIPCPHCGTRPIQEFVYGEIPLVPDSLTDPDERDLDRAFMRTNPEGIQIEAWFHAYGCRRWLKLRRDTRTDKIIVQSGGSHNPLPENSGPGHPPTI